MDHESPPTNAPARMGPGFARRDFLKGSGAAMAATALATQADAQQKAATKESKIAKGPTAIKLTVNGKAIEGNQVPYAPAGSTVTVLCEV